MPYIIPANNYSEFIFTSNAPNHYLNYCKLIFNRNIRNKHENFFNRMQYIFSIKIICKCRSQNGGHFVSASMFQSFKICLVSPTRNRKLMYYWSSFAKWWIIYWEETIYHWNHFVVMTHTAYDATNLTFSNIAVLSLTCEAKWPNTILNLVALMGK